MALCLWLYNVANPAESAVSYQRLTDDHVRQGSSTKSYQVVLQCVLRRCFVTANLLSHRWNQQSVYFQKIRHWAVQGPSPDAYSPCCRPSQRCATLNLLLRSLPMGTNQSTNAKCTANRAGALGTFRHQAPSLWTLPRTRELVGLVSPAAVGSF